MIRSLFTFLCLLFLGGHLALNAISAAVAIPCYYKHFQYLPSLLSALARQTTLPNEVVIALSQVEYLSEEAVDALELGPWPFRVEIIRRNGICLQGANRTLAARHCSADVIFCIDADDVPHSQRIEAVLQLFEALPEADMVLCGHAYRPGKAIVCEPSIPFFTPKKYTKLKFTLGSDTWLEMGLSDLTNWASGVHNGSPALRRYLIDEGFYWSDLKNGEDLIFNQSVIETNHKVYLIKLPLLHYFNLRSSGKDVGRDAIDS